MGTPANDSIERMPPALTEMHGPWTGLLDILAPGVEELGDLPVFVRVRSVRFLSQHRVWRSIPVSEVKVSADTWEVRLMAPGFARRNDIGRSALCFRDFVSQLQAAADRGGLFNLVVSDTLELTHQDLFELATKRGHEWSGPDLAELTGDEYVGYLDVPIRSMRPRPHRRWVELDLELVV